MGDFALDDVVGVPRGDAAPDPTAGLDRVGDGGKLAPVGEHGGHRAGAGESPALGEPQAAPQREAALVAAVAELIERCDAGDRAKLVLSCFNVDICRALVEALPNVAVAFLFERPPRVVPPGEPEALSAALASLVKDPVRRRSLGEAGNARVRADFALEGNFGRLAKRFGLATHADRVLRSA